jgi:hypothetical protein
MVERTDKIHKDNIIITNLRYKGVGTRISFMLDLGEIEMNGIQRVNTIVESIDEAQNIINYIINYSIYKNNQ